MVSEFLQDCMILPAQADTNGSFVYEVCWLSSNDSAKSEWLECQTSMSHFVMFCVGFGHFCSRHFNHKYAFKKL